MSWKNTRELQMGPNKTFKSKLWLIPVVNNLPNDNEESAVLNVKQDKFKKDGKYQNSEDESDDDKSDDDELDDGVVDYDEIDDENFNFENMLDRSKMKKNESVRKESPISNILQNININSDGLYQSTNSAFETIQNKCLNSNFYLTNDYYVQNLNQTDCYPNTYSNDNENYLGKYTSALQCYNYCEPNSISSSENRALFGGPHSSSLERIYPSEFGDFSNIDNYSYQNVVEYPNMKFCTPQTNCGNGTNLSEYFYTNNLMINDHLNLNGYSNERVEGHLINNNYFVQN